MGGGIYLMKKYINISEAIPLWPITYDTILFIFKDLF